ncbi:MAG: zf-HC2 domain-containing protein [Thermoanaerobaculia bacterium]
MSCDRIRDLLDDFLAGELPADVSNEVHDHLGRCISCRREWKELQDLLQQTAELPAEILPERDLWPEIELRIAGTRRPAEEKTTGSELSRPWWLYLAAAVLALAVFSVPLSRWWLGQRPEDAPQARSQPVGLVPAATSTAADIARSQDGVLHARKDLLEVLERRRDRLEPEVLVVVEENMRILDEAIGQLHLALEEDPGNRRLHFLLATRYQQEVNLAKRVSRV